MYNVIKSDVIGFLFYMLMFGWNFKFLIDLFLGLDFGNEGDVNFRGYVEKF